MTATIPDVWPSEFATATQASPLTILRQQAYALGQKTRNLVVGEVESQTEPGEKGMKSFLHTFSISASLLGFQQVVLLARHAIKQYPVTVARMNANGEHQKTTLAKDSDEFINFLREELNSPDVLDLIGSLVTQCRDVDE